jgi:hypothetical protein
MRTIDIKKIRHAEFVEWVPVHSIFNIRNATYSPHSELQDDSLINELEEVGMLEPVEIGVGVWSQRIRLDTGNHKIYLAEKMGLTRLPCVARVWNYCAFHPENGDHSFQTDIIKMERKWLTEEFYARPSEILDL